MINEPPPEPQPVVGGQAAGEPGIKENLLKGHKAAGKTFRAHLDGYDQGALLIGEEPGARKEIFCFDVGANLNALRYNDWKIHWTIMECSINEAYRTTPSWPLIINLRMDPYEVSPDSAMYIRWFDADQMWIFVPAQAAVTKSLESFRGFPPTTGGSLSIDSVLLQMQAPPRQ